MSDEQLDRFEETPTTNIKSHTHNERSTTDFFIPPFFAFSRRLHPRSETLAPRDSMRMEFPCHVDAPNLCDSRSLVQSSIRVSFHSLRPFSGTLLFAARPRDRQPSPFPLCFRAGNTGRMGLVSTMYTGGGINLIMIRVHAKFGTFNLLEEEFSFACHRFVHNQDLSLLLARTIRNLFNSL